jgi:farnesyl-diphosphate farnesyltransferase
VFWTRLAVARLPSLRARAGALGRAGRRYGRGLQLVNVLRDLPRDLARGRCLLPADELGAAGLAPRDLLRADDPAVAAALAPILARWGARARRGSLAGLWYTARLPASAWRLRVGTALPAALALATLRRLEAETRRLDPEVVVRVPRAELARLARRTALLCAFPRGPLRLARET